MSTGQKPYRWLAEYYDRVFRFHQGWGEAARRRILGRILPGVKTACDLACGSGTTALKLAKRGIRTYGVDLSPGMCRVARRRVRETGLQVRVSRQDMRRFKLPERVDLVLCEYDALNHVPRKRDLSRVLKAVAGAPKPGGYFFFDVNNRRGFEGYWKGVWCVEKPGILLVMNNGNKAARDRAWSDCVWFIRKGGLWARHTERVEEVCWSEKEMRGALGEAGFGPIRSWDSTPFFKGNPIIKRVCRTHYLARKKMPKAGP
jgi:SAM-dependent methyltransferase